MSFFPGVSILLHNDPIAKEEFAGFVGRSEVHMGFLKLLKQGMLFSKQ